MRIVFLLLRVPDEYLMHSTETELASLDFERLDAPAIAGLGFDHSQFDFEPRLRLKSRCPDCTSLINISGSLDFLFLLWLFLLTSKGCPQLGYF